MESNIGNTAIIITSSHSTKLNIHFKKYTAMIFSILFLFGINISIVLANSTPMSLVKDINETGNSSPGNLVDVDGTLFFTANDGINGRELWKTDGTLDGTVLIKDIQSGASNANISNISNVNGTIYFFAQSKTSGYELWKSDGTTEGTLMVRKVYSKNNKFYPSKIINLNNILYFSVISDINGYELWKSDGSPTGTIRFKNIWRNDITWYYADLREINGSLFFTADDGIHGKELWTSDGTASGTVMLKDIYPGPEGSNIWQLLGFNGKVYFNADNGVHGSELWVTNGTTTGTVMVKDIRSGYKSSDLSILSSSFSLGDTFFFTAYTGDYGRELWISDGTSAGTTMVKDIKPGSASSHPRYFAKINDIVYFFLGTLDGGTELWKSNGTTEGTLLVKDIKLSVNSPKVRSMVVLNDILYFDERIGGGLWRSDGSTEGTFIVKSMGPQIFHWDMQVIDDKLYFLWNDDIHGIEYWVSDGTSEGTKLLQDIDPGVSDAFIYYSRLLVSGPRVFLRANTQEYGRELWSFPLESRITIQSQIKSGSDDAEEDGNGFIRRDSSDLELVQDRSRNQTVGLRFTELQIPQGAMITNAFLEFTVDETNSNKIDLLIEGQASSNATGFTKATHNISQRDRTTSNVVWRNEAAWTTVGSSQQSPNIRTVVQEIINQDNWKSGNALAIIITGSTNGKRVADSYNGNKAGAPKLIIEYRATDETATVSTPTISPNGGTFTDDVTISLSSNTNEAALFYTLDSSEPTERDFLYTAPFELTESAILKVKGFLDGSTPSGVTSGNFVITTSSETVTTQSQINRGSDDAEEETNGTIRLDSSDLELVQDRTRNQTVGLRFTDLDIPQGANIISAHLEFTVDEVNVNDIDLLIEGQADANANTFNSEANNISNRARTNAEVVWNNATEWTTIGEQQQSPDVSSVVQEIVNQSNWLEGNALAIIITGSTNSKRVADSYNGNRSGAPKLIVEYSFDDL